MRTQCKNNLKQIGIALWNYESEYGAFPPAMTVDAEGKPLHSWRTLLLPYLDQAALYRKIDLSKPWDDPANEFALKIHIPSFECPAADRSQCHTAYLAVVGTACGFRAEEPRQRLEITNDPAETIMVIEAPMDRAVHWMQPLDADAALVLGIGPKSRLQHGESFHAVMVDGSVKAIPANTPEFERRRLISISSKLRPD